MLLRIYLHNFSDKNSPNNQIKITLYLFTKIIISVSVEGKGDRIIKTF